jgi:hypothetical protein
MIGALSAGVKTVLLPAHNRKEVRELPDEVKTGLEIIFIRYVIKKTSGPEDSSVVLCLSFSPSGSVAKFWNYTVLSAAWWLWRAAAFISWGLIC